MEKLFIEDLKISGKKVLMRVDFNVPLDSDQNILDSTRIEATLPSIKYVLMQGGALVLMSHLGRPGNASDPELSLTPCATFLSNVLGKEVIMAPDCVGGKVKALAEKLKPGEILLLENLRFHRAEEHPTEEFAGELSSYADLYVNDAFGASHREHASICTVPKYFPGKAAAGYLLAKEVKFLSEHLQNPKRPFFALIGGAKISTKMGVLKSLLNHVDGLLIGGGMGFTFQKALGKKVGASMVEEELIPVAKEILQTAGEKKIQLLLPVDVVAAKEISDDAKTTVCEMDSGIPDDLQGLDIGPKTADNFKNVLKDVGTILWNGPVGVFELGIFAKGTFAMAKAISESKGVTIVAGGDTIAAVNAAECADKITHLSTGGGAALEFIEYGTLPGIEALSDRTFVAK